MGTKKLFWRQPDKMLGGNLRWTSIPSRASRNTPSRFILQKPEISAGTDAPSGSLNYDWGRLYVNSRVTSLCYPLCSTTTATGLAALKSASWRTSCLCLCLRVWYLWWILAWNSSKSCLISAFSSFVSKRPVRGWSVGKCYSGKCVSKQCESTFVYIRKT